MNSQLEWLTRQIDEGLELYIFIDERNVMNGFEHRIAPYVNVEGLCENIRRWNSQTLKLREFSGFGVRDSSLLYELALSLGLLHMDEYLNEPTQLSKCGALKSGLVRDSVLSIKKYNNEMYYSSVINLGKGETEPYVRQGEATGETIEEALVKTARMYNIIKNKEAIEHLKNEILQSSNSYECENE